MLRHLPCHFSSAVSPPREEDQSEWSAGFSSPVNLAFLHVIFSNAL